MGFPRPLQGGRQRRRIEQKVYETLLVFDRETDVIRLFDRPVRGFLGGGNDEVADAATCNSAARFTTAKASGAIRASIRALRPCSLGIMLPPSEQFSCTAFYRTKSILA